MRGTRVTYISEVTLVKNSVVLYRAVLRDTGVVVYWNIFGEITTAHGKRRAYNETNGAKTRAYNYICELKQRICMETIEQCAVK